jgi:hypothetical protein
MTRPPLTESQRRFRTRSTIVSFGVTALLLVIFGAIAAFMPFRSLRADDVLCFAAAFILLQMGLVMGYVHAVQPRDAPMPRARLSQVINPALGGAALLLPILGERYIDPNVNFALIMAVYGIASWATWIVWREADEFMRAMLRDASVAAFHVTVLALAVYATGERLGLLGGATAWGYFGFVSLANIGCSFWAIYRHGADRPPVDE